MRKSCEEPFSPTDVIRARTLSAAFVQLVFRSPASEKLRRRALAYAKRRRFLFEGDGGVLHRHSELHFPMLMLSDFTPPSWDYEPSTGADKILDRFYFGGGKSVKPDPITKHADALRSRAASLIKMLQRQEVDAWPWPSSTCLIG